MFFLFYYHRDSDINRQYVIIHIYTKTAYKEFKLYILFYWSSKDQNYDYRNLC